MPTVGFEFTISVLERAKTLHTFRPRGPVIDNDRQVQGFRLTQHCFEYFIQ
jgi:hypothetical protein